MNNELISLIFQKFIDKIENFVWQFHHCELPDFDPKELASNLEAEHIVKQLFDDIALIANHTDSSAWKRLVDNAAEKAAIDFVNLVIKGNYNATIN